MPAVGGAFCQVKPRPPVAASPGPPARSTRGGRLAPSLAGITTTFNAIIRPSGRSRFSGTVKDPQRAARIADFAFLERQLVRRNGLAGVPIGLNAGAYRGHLSRANPDAPAGSSNGKSRNQGRDCAVPEQYTMDVECELCEREGGTTRARRLHVCRSLRVTEWRLGIMARFAPGRAKPSHVPRSRGW